MSNIPKHLLNSKLITDEEWEEYQDLKEKINDFRIKLSAREEVAREYEAELKDANDSIVWWQNRYKALERETERLRTDLNTSDMRIEKAIEVIKNKYPVLCESEGDFKEELLNILQNGSDK